MVQDRDVVTVGC